jgi:uncharacterized repeat protein (TIGR03803 family)
MRPNRYPIAAKTFFAIYLVLLLMLAITAPPAQAQTFKVLRTFGGTDGDGPAAQLVRDSMGNLYGTTIGGGNSTCPAGGCGTAFKMNKAGKLVWLHKFQGANGDNAYTGLLRDAAGILYGTTAFGGKANHVCGSIGCGVLFELDMNGKETILHKFNGTDGSSPFGPLIQDGLGGLYGVTQSGSDGGTVFKHAAAGRETVIYKFGCGSDRGESSAFYLGG